MKLDYIKIKKYLQVVFFSIDLLVFLLVLFSTNSKSKKYKEYTGSSKFFLDLYIILIYAILIVITLLPRLLYHRIKKYIVFMFGDKGKIIISFAISLVYWFARNKPQLVLGIILTITSILLLIYEFIFHFAKVDNFLSSKGIEFSNQGQSTFDMDSIEKNVNNNLATPMSKGNTRYESKPSEGNNNSFEGNTSGSGSGNIGGDSNPQNPQQEQYQKDVEISSGYDNNPNQQGFGF